MFTELQDFLTYFTTLLPECGWLQGQPYPNYPLTGNGVGEKEWEVYCQSLREGTSYILNICDHMIDHYAASVECQLETQLNLRVWLVDPKDAVLLFYLNYQNILLNYLQLN